MHHTLLYILALLFAVFLLVLLARKLKIAYPIFLVLAGLGICFIPGVPTLHLDPDLIFLIFLPPLLYEAAWYTSWNDFWKWKRPIILLAFGLVFFTSSIVAYASVALIPGFTLALGFLLGGIVSPPDAVAAASVLKGMSVPKRLMTILEGESLVNDASSLIVFRFALLAAISGSFSLQEAVVQFFLVAGMGVVVGLVGANFMYLIHRYLPTNVAIDAALTVMTPYLLFLLAEQFHFSGVMAVVSGGLYMSYRSHEVFQNGSTRLNMLGVWTTMIFVMNALVFILIGLELPEIIQGLGEYSVIQAIKYSLWVSVLVILLRFLWVYPAAHLPRWISRKVRKEPSPGWKGPLVISWAGMRGVVSLATALSIPLYLTDGVAFPQRNLILFITFGVILVTLVFQGLTLPFILRIIHLEEIDAVVPAEIQRAGIQKHLNQIALAELKGIEGNDWLNIFKAKLEREEQPQPLSVKKREEFHAVLLKIYSLQRKELFKLRRENAFSDEEIRRAELQLDLDEMSITGAEH
ncbi:sodium/proton antiporter, CPA1 family [Leadbetterella byssophila DSM 17132]|uniref:Sodium/proton antiporter, CPA1 family n=1 Tax=Leadbetterella byssophila (strain DSM 17132 / JCM 16389 / KACC 11308 / NBRC 106382 / 4M15) TaxID=649349 RepID=E4RRK0_LEAB4|nr:Na+/H+ antiporter [Leadbetterella byssophila]ADQ16656.1 sodium/proton antiporter, CPA1 family [Leadbetterella byssophila DSM 17132]